MKKMTSTIGFIGAGNMGEALIGALIKSKITSPERIVASDASEKRLKQLSKKYAIRVRKDNRTLFSECGIVLLAVKPQHMDEVLSEITQDPKYAISCKKCVISIAAGISISALEKRLYKSLPEKDRKKLPIIRVMPNTPALVLSGMAGMSSNRYASGRDRMMAKTILASAGEVIECDEKDLDAVTAVSGSGPAYVFYFIESMISGGYRAGLNQKNARKLTLETFKGAVKLLEESRESPESLISKVASPGGTTAAALNVMTQSKVKEHIIRAITAAKKRSIELRKLNA